MKKMLIVGMMFLACFANAQEKIKMYYNNEEITKIIEVYSKASGQKFIVDPGVRGKVSIFLQDAVTVEEAFNHLSSALALNGFAISKQGDTMVVKNARAIQRDLIEVSTQLPNLKPERMYTWVYTLKHVPASSVNRDLRIITSRDGEMSVNPSLNQLVITDWVSNLNRVADLLKEVDKPVDPAVAKLVEASKKDFEAHKKETEARKQEQMKKKE